MVVGPLIEVTIDGIARGLLFAILGVGITLVFGLGGILNIAIGIFAIIAAIAAVVALGAASNVVAASITGVVLVGFLGLAVDRTVLSQVYRSEGEERILLGIFVTLGLAIFLEGVLYVYYPLSYSLPLGVPSLDVLGISIRGSTQVTIVASIIILTLLFVFLRRTYLGKATRTVFQDEMGAELSGIEPRRIRSLIFVLSTVIVGIAGILYSFSRQVTVGVGFELTIFALIVAIVGGVRSLRGTAVAGVFLGLVVTYANWLIGAYVAKVILFVVAIIVLIIKPEEMT